MMRLGLIFPFCHRLPAIFYFVFSILLQIFNIYYFILIPHYYFNVTLKFDYFILLELFLFVFCFISFKVFLILIARVKRSQIILKVWELKKASIRVRPSKAAALRSNLSSAHAETLISVLNLQNDMLTGQKWKF